MYKDIAQRNARQRLGFELRRAQDKAARAQRELSDATEATRRIESAMAEIDTKTAEREAGPAAVPAPPSVASVFEEISSLFGLEAADLQALLQTDDGRDALQSAARASGAKLKKHLTGQDQPDKVDLDADQGKGPAKDKNMQTPDRAATAKKTSASSAA